MDRLVVPRKPAHGEDTISRESSIHKLRRPPITPESRRRSLTNGLCRPCYQISTSFLQSVTAAELRGLRPRCINNIRLAKIATSCPFCTFFSSVARGVASHGGEVQQSVYSECSLHASAFSDVFFDVQDRPWFDADDDDQVVFYMSPLYLRGPKAADWALRHNTCFMLLGGRAAGVSARELSPQADLGVARGWIEHCDQGHTHPDCSPAVELRLPGFQVIDCEARALVTWPGPAPYVTLSYVWGTDEAEARGDNASLPDTLPRLIEDAISVSSFLGYRYLWVDRYCIPQDDEEVKAGLIRNMDKIYSESALTIIASASERPSEGLTGVGMDRTELPCSVKTEDLSLTQIFTNLADEVERSRWNTRGWTYQEGFLSNRRLLFTKSQCYFQCGELWCTEGIRLPLDILSRLNSPGHSKLSRVFPWVTKERTALDSVHLDRQGQRKHYFVERVREYMRRELTHDKDAFNAFAGVLNYLKWFSGEFLLGDIMGLPVWDTSSRWSPDDRDGRDTFLHSLAWSLVVPQWPRRDMSVRDVAERRDGLPSWTWCGWKLPVPSPNHIRWSEGWRSQDNETSAQTEIRIELEDGGSVPRTPHTCDVAGLLGPADTRGGGSPRLLRVRRGWVSELLVPATCWNMNYDGGCQCGPYRLERRDVRYLSIAAEHRGLPLTERGYVLTAWFFSPLVFDLVRDNCRSEVMVLVGAAGAPGTYERLHALCQVKMEYFTGRPSIEDMARRFGWELMDFKLG